MRADRPLILSVLLLAGGLAMLTIYGTGSSNMSLAYPVSESTMHAALTAGGPAAVGGLALTALGVLLLLWSFLWAVISEIGSLSPRQRVDRTLRADPLRVDRERVVEERVVDTRRHPDRPLA